ncbi:hypothetical protein TUBRATIS_19950 [Tubulinosema ratisbonensis]|uniref:Uncharacterized protein n=1 Tax=Tubulinosema ratisbonensis TaxID=291195 RepID=A0A437AK37_9MICR|nr:hypothetical protein TUBRATIS_19950 [Tubulinosema ratisbonensis]
MVFGKITMILFINLVFSANKKEDKNEMFDINPINDFNKRPIQGNPRKDEERQCLLEVEECKEAGQETIQVARPILLERKTNEFINFEEEIKIATPKENKKPTEEKEEEKKEEGNEKIDEKSTKEHCQQKDYDVQEIEDSLKESEEEKDDKQDDDVKEIKVSEETSKNGNDDNQARDEEAEEKKEVEGLVENDESTETVYKEYIGLQQKFIFMLRVLRGLSAVSPYLGGLLTGYFLYNLLHK